MWRVFDWRFDTRVLCRWRRRDCCWISDIQIARLRGCDLDVTPKRFARIATSIRIVCQNMMLAGDACANRSLSSTRDHPA